MRIEHSPIKIMMDAFLNFHSLLKYDAHTPKILMQLGNTSQEKIDFFRALPKLSFRETINCEKNDFCEIIL